MAKAPHLHPMASHLALSMVLSVAAAPAEDPAASAVRFVERLYGLAGPAVPEDERYSPELAKLIDQAITVARRTDDPDLVGDALCNCQDITEFRPNVNIVSATASAATVHVLLAGGADGPRNFLLKLVRTPAGWRVADSIDDMEVSYADNLRSGIAGE